MDAVGIYWVFGPFLKGSPGDGQRWQDGDVLEDEEEDRHVCEQQNGTVVGGFLMNITTEIYVFFLRITILKYVFIYGV